MFDLIQDVVAKVDVAAKVDVGATTSVVQIMREEDFQKESKREVFGRRLRAWFELKKNAVEPRG